MLTKDEIIAEMKLAVEMAKNEVDTCKEWNIDHEAFIPWMFGWMQSTLEQCARDLEQL